MTLNYLLAYLIKNKDVVVPFFLLFSLFYTIVEAMGVKRMIDVVLCKKSHELARFYMKLELLKGAIEVLNFFGLSIIGKKFAGLVAKKEIERKILFDKVLNTDVEIAADIYIMRYHLLCYFIFFVTVAKSMGMQICYSSAYYPSEPILYHIFKVQVLLKKIIDYFNLDITINLTDYQICMFLDYCIFCQAFGAIVLVGWLIGSVVPVSVYRASFNIFKK
jgi:hypothetical protein